MDNAAHGLLGKTLKSGWTVIKKIEKEDNQTGSFFSVCYLVEKEEEICFMKAFDFAKFLSISVEEDKSMMDVMNDMTTAYKYERDLSKHCQDHHVTKVAFVKEASEEIVPGYSITIVPYLVFDLAEGDVRKTMAYSHKVNLSWKLKSLHDVAVGLMQLHKIEVSHQDLKPSNILVYKEVCKIGDLGRSMCQAMEGPYNNRIFTGDWTYAPPELMYRYHEKDWKSRVFATDCYLLGSLISFYFSGLPMTALIRNHLPDKFSWEKWKGKFEEIEPYLQNAFEDAIKEFSENIESKELKSELTKLVKYLCNPFPKKRGHPINLNQNSSNFGLERFVTRLDYLKRKSEINLFKI